MNQSSQAWEDSAAACSALSLAVVVLHGAKGVQGQLLRGANLTAPDECSWLLSTLLPRLETDVVGARSPQPSAKASLKQLLMGALQALSRLQCSRPFTEQEQARLPQLRLVIDAEGRKQQASRFVLLDGAADGLRPLMSGPEWPLQPLPSEYGAFAALLEAGGLHTHIDSSLFAVIAQCCHAGALARLPGEALPSFRDALAAAAAAAQPPWEPSQMAKLPVFAATDGSLVAAGGAWVAPDAEWQQLLHYHRTHLPLPVLHWHGADATQRRLLNAAGLTELEQVAMSVERDLLPYVRAHSANRRLEPLVLHSLRCLEGSDSAGVISLHFSSVVFDHDGAAKIPSHFTLLPSGNSTIESLLPASQFPRLPAQYHSFSALLSAAGLQTELTMQMLECCIKNFQQQHAAGSIDATAGITLLQQLLSRRDAFASSAVTDLRGRALLAFKHFVLNARCVSLSFE